ncbi:MAG: alpha/beta fold hydrolase [Terriglobales bacterium]
MPAPWLNSVDSWFASGERVQVVLPPAQRGGAARVWSIFCRVAGEGPWLTLLHGFPTCSWDWAQVAPLLEPDRRLLLFDFLGFGDSDKPYRHDYSLFEQTDIVEALWRRFGVERTEVVAHDYGVTVAQELLARKSACKLATRVESVTFLNGGVYPGMHRPLPIQRMLANRVLGPLVNLFVNEQTFRRNFSRIFSRQHPVSEAEMAEHWKAIARSEGVRNYHRLIHYMHERMAHRERWTGAMESSTVPVRFVWGMQDPIAGAPMATHIRQRLPRAEFVALENAGHYPQIETPEVVAQKILGR